MTMQVLSYQNGKPWNPSHDPLVFICVDGEWVAWRIFLRQRSPMHKYDTIDSLLRRGQLWDWNEARLAHPEWHLEEDINIDLRVGLGL